MDDPPQFVTLAADVVERYRNSAAFDAGTTAYRNGQALTDNPYGKTERDEWHSWVDGWQLVRNAVEHERSRVEFAEQAARDAMEAGLRECARLREAIALMDLDAMGIGHIVLDPQEGSAEERCEYALSGVKHIADIARVAESGGAEAEMWNVCGWSRGDPEDYASKVCRP